MKTAGAVEGRAAVTALVAADDQVRRRILGLIDPSVWVLGEAEDLEGLLRIARELRPDVVLVSIGLLPGGGIEAVRRLREEAPQSRVVLLTSNDEDAYLGATGRSGADALLPLKVARKEILATIRMLTRGHVPAWDRADRRGTWAPSRGRHWDGTERRRPPRGIG